MDPPRTLHRHTADLVRHTERLQRRALTTLASKQRAPMGQPAASAFAASPPKHAATGGSTYIWPQQLATVPPSAHYQATQAELRALADLSAVREEVALKRVQWLVHNERASSAAPPQPPPSSSSSSSNVGRRRRGLPGQSAAALSLRSMDTAAAASAHQHALETAATNACWAQVGRALLQEPQSVAPWEAPEGAYDVRNGSSTSSSSSTNTSGVSFRRDGVATSGGDSNQGVPVCGLPATLPDRGLPRSLQTLPKVWDQLGLVRCERDAIYRRLNADLAPQVRDLTTRAYDCAIGSNGRGALGPNDRAALDRQLAEVG
jgi:hypothetical protein